MSTQVATTANRPSRKRIGEILMEAGLINDEVLALALAESKKSNQLLGDTLVRIGKITVEQLGMALSVQHGVKYANISKAPANKALLDLLPEEFMREKQVVPISKERGRLVVAMVNPSNREAIDEITFITGMRPLVTVVPYIEFHEFFTKHIGDTSAASSILEAMSTTGGRFSEVSEVDTLRQQRDAEMSGTSEEPAC